MRLCWSQLVVLTSFFLPHIWRGSVALFRSIEIVRIQRLEQVGGICRSFSASPLLSTWYHHKVNKTEGNLRNQGFHPDLCQKFRTSGRGLTLSHSQHGLLEGNCKPPLSLSHCFPCRLAPNLTIQFFWMRHMVQSPYTTPTSIFTLQLWLHSPRLPWEKGKVCI